MLQVNRTEDGLYNAVSWLSFIFELSDQNTTFGCEVQHKALVKPTTKKFTPHVIGMFSELQFHNCKYMLKQHTFMDILNYMLSLLLFLYYSVFEI